MQISDILWTAADVEHIASHGVSPDEVEEVLAAAGALFRRGRTHPETGRASLYAFGQTEAGRYLFVVLSPRGRGRVRCVTARDMDDTARRYYERRRR